jgi:hypothetical protein
MELFVNNSISRFLLTSSILSMGIMVSSCAKFSLPPMDSPTTPQVAATAQATPKKLVDPGLLNVVAQAAQKAGVVDCLARINQFSTFLTTGAQQSGASLLASPQTPNEHLMSVVFEIRSPQALSYASTDFAPLAAGCAGTYETVTHWQNSCKDVATKGYPQLKFNAAIQSNILMSDGGGQVHVFLMPAGAGCVAIKKEVVY